MASLLDWFIFDEVYGSRILPLLLCTLGNRNCTIPAASFNDLVLTTKLPS